MFPSSLFVLAKFPLFTKARVSCDPEKVFFSLDSLSLIRFLIGFNCWCTKGRLFVVTSILVVDLI